MTMTVMCDITLIPNPKSKNKKINGKKKEMKINRVYCF